jgi:hypothetical protein
MSESAIQLFSCFHQTVLWEIAAHLDLTTLQNLIDIIAPSHDHLKTILMLVVETKMKEVRDSCRLLLWIPEHFTRHLNRLSESSLAHVTLLTTLFGDANRARILKYMKHTFTEAEQPALQYITQVYDKSSPLHKEQNELYKEILDECAYRHYVKHAL